MLKFIAVSFFLILGTALAAVGVPLGLWVALAVYRAEEARSQALWALEQVLPHGTSVQLASDAIQRNALIALGIAAAVLCFMALAALRSARQELRPAGGSHGGKGKVELSTQSLRVGRPVAGSIWLPRNVEPEEDIWVGLSCKRSHGSGADATVEVAFNEVLNVPAVRTSTGWSAPFCFNIPAIAPPSGGGYRWRLAYTLSRQELPSVLPLELDPAPEEAFSALERRQAPGHPPPDGSRQPPVVAQQPSAATGLPVVTRPSSLVPHETRREPTLRGEPHLRASASAPVDRIEVPEAPGMRRFVKWTLILVFGVPLGIGAVALVTVAVLTILR